MGAMDTRIRREHGTNEAWHAVPEYRTHRAGEALCGFKPAADRGWSLEEGESITCQTCLHCVRVEARSAAPAPAAAAELEEAAA